MVMRATEWGRLFWIGGVTGVLLAACSGERDNQLVVGMELAYPPFETVAEDGEPMGVSVDMAHALGESLEREIIIRNIPFDGLIPALKTGRIDLIISSMTKTPERDQSIDFSAPYVSTGLCLLVAKDRGIKSINDLNESGRTVVVKKGTTGHIYAAAHLSQADIRLLDKETLCVLEVASGRADAFIYDQISVLRNWQLNSETTVPLLEPFQKEYWAIGLREGETELRQQVDQFLADYRDAGGFRELAQKYFDDEQQAFDKFGVPFVFDVSQPTVQPGAAQ